MKRLLIITIAFFFSLFFSSLKADEFFRVWLKDKKDSPYSLHRPEEFLTKASLDRRNKQNYSLSEEDLPLSPSYVSRLDQLGQVIAKSRWMNTVLLCVETRELQKTITSLPFVDSVEWVGSYIPSQTEATKSGIRRVKRNRSTHSRHLASIRSESKAQITALRGEKLHKEGYRGEGIKIAILDAGFPAWDSLSLINANQVHEFADFGYPAETGYGKEKHGTLVLSILLADSDDSMRGTAPAASFYLYKTECTGYELPVEEDFWVSALERADSVGVDIVNSSLGYHTFDIPSLNHQRNEINKSTVFISRAARKAVSKGMFLVISAGNDAMNQWGVIGFPADVQEVLTVGSVDRSARPSSFSSTGFVSGNYVKPDLAAIGTGTILLNPDGTFSSSDGTSFSTPIITGLVACLWQACPELSNQELLDVVRRSGSQYRKPDKFTGYGIPDFSRAWRSAQESTEAKRK
ncbi:MAG: S8 family serine peptidase [Bacteroidales bacterium]